MRRSLTIASRARRFSFLGLPAIVVVALGLRLWGIGWGLPFAFNLDEHKHFVPHAVAMTTHGLDPHWFVNPPGLTYVFYLLFRLWFGSGAAVSHAFASDPTKVYLLSRIAVAVIAAASVALLGAAGTRLFDRRVGLLAAALLAVSFLDVFYSHLALDDSAALAPLCLSLVGIAGVARRGARIDYLLAGAGLGLAVATKYTTAIVALPLLGAMAPRLRHRDAIQLRRVVLVAAAAFAAFALADPYGLLDWGTATQQLHHEAIYTHRPALLGQTQHNGLVFYLWSLTWGLGWAPVVAALAGAGLLLVEDRRRALVLVPAPVVFLILMGQQGRFFARWLLPIYPMLCLLAAHAAIRTARAVRATAMPRLAPVAAALVGALLLGQGAVHSVHTDLVLSREDTRSLARSWMAAHLPADSGIVAEPIGPADWLDRRSSGPGQRGAWRRFVRSRSEVRELAESFRGAVFPADFQNYERTLFPGLIRTYRRERDCWVVTGSTERGRGLVDPRRVPDAIRYYRDLGRGARLDYTVSPYGPHAKPVPFDFDWSFDFYPLAFRRPGPAIEIYRLDGCRTVPPADTPSRTSRA